MGIFDLGLLEIVLVCIGISFDVLAVSVCYGSCLMEIDKKKLLKVIGIFCLCQTAGCVLGEMVSFIDLFRENTGNAELLRHACSIVILMAMGVFLLIKGWKQDDILERREEIDFKKVWLSALLASIDSLFAGVGFALWSSNLLEAFVCIAVITALAVLIGIVVGYHLGWEPKKKAYFIGAAVLLASAVDVLIRLLVR